MSKKYVDLKIECINVEDVNYILNLLKNDNRPNSNYLRANIFWGLSRSCGYCKDYIDGSGCKNKLNKADYTENCEIKNCPLLK